MKKKSTRVRRISGMARQGLGVALGLKSLRSGYLDRGELVQPFKDELAINEGFYLVTSEQSLERPDVVAFKNWMVESMKDMSDESTGK